MVQGSLNGPNTFGPLSALVGRISQGCFDPQELRLQIYSDDPCAVIRGSSSRRRLLCCTLLLIWLLLGFDLAYDKGQRGRSITWIGYSMQLEANMIRVSIKDASMKVSLMDTLIISASRCME